MANEKSTAKKVATKPVAKTTTKAATKPAAKTTKAATKPATKTTAKVATKPATKTTTKVATKSAANNNENSVNVSVYEMVQLNKQINDTALFVQAILVSALVILGICTIFLPVMSFVTEVMLALALFVMGYNNYMTFKRKGFTIAYFIVGLIVIIIGIIAQVYGL